MTSFTYKNRKDSAWYWFLTRSYFPYRTGYICNWLYHLVNFGLFKTTYLRLPRSFATEIFDKLLIFIDVNHHSFLIKNVFSAKYVTFDRKRIFVFIKDVIRYYLFRFIYFTKDIVIINEYVWNSLFICKLSWAVETEAL